MVARRLRWFRRVVVIAASGAGNMIAGFMGSRYLYVDDLPEPVALPAMVAEVPDAKIKKLR